MGKPNESKKGGRKIGRNKVKCARYAVQGRKARNKARKAAKHRREHPGDLAASE